MAPYVSRSSVASASYSFEGILDENKNITNEKERKFAKMRAEFRIPVASWKYSLNKLVDSVDEVGYHVFQSFSTYSFKRP
jgi:isopenicillin N synthase-like dioxygenase